MKGKMLFCPPEKRPVLIPALAVLTIFLCFAFIGFAQEQGTSSSQEPPQQSQPSVPPAPVQTTPTEPAQPAPEKTAKPAQEELANQTCLDCHNKDLLKASKEELAEQVVVDDQPLPPRPKPRFITGDLSLSIDYKKYTAGVHADTTCVTCHKDVDDLPHKQRLKAVNCNECHEESETTVRASSHGDKAGPKAPGCIGCHDVHYGKGTDSVKKDFKRTICVNCHKAYDLDVDKGHKGLYEAKMHLAAVECMSCHSGKEAGVHSIPKVKEKVAACDTCHSKKTILSQTKAQPVSCLYAGFINADSLKKYGYVLGAHRIPGLDAIIILAIVAPLGLPLVHGGLRFVCRRKGPIHLPEEKIYLHPLPERIWHWVQALCIVMLIITGAMLHWPEKFPGWFNWAVTVHNWFGIGAVAAFLFWLVYNLVTGRIMHYIPKKGEIPTGMIRQAKFYGYGIFKHEPHPYAPSEDNKFNPLQKIAYLKFQLLLFPVLLISGILYMYPETFKGIIDAIGGMTVLGLVHFILGGLFAAFLVAHLYLATTGETVAENFKAIITGYGIKAEHDEHEKH